MTDAAVRVTQSAVEQFSKRFLQSVGCTFEENDEHIVISVPEGTDIGLSHGDHRLTRGESQNTGEQIKSVHPESEFFQQLLQDASERYPVGAMSIQHNSAVELPAWIENSLFELQEARFTPYYNRTAVVFLFKISVETVSEYQQEFLRAVAVDKRSTDPIPQLAETFLEATSITTDTLSDHDVQSQLTEKDVQSLLSTAQTQLLDAMDDQIEEIHQEASRAADSEVEEYRRMQQQRIEELQEESAELSSRIDDLSEKINTGEGAERVQALKKRQELKTEHDELAETLTELQERRDRGFPDRQREIRERHSLTVTTTPLTLTVVEYERGEADFELTDQQRQTTRSLRVGYGSGVGVIDDAHCSVCESQLTGANPISHIEPEFQCQQCAGR